MNQTLSLPSRDEIRAAVGANIAAWAKLRGVPPHAVHMTITRYADTKVDMSRPWGAQTRRVLLAIHETLQATERGQVT